MLTKQINPVPIRGKIRIYTDGSSRGNNKKNSGKAAIGILICDEKDNVIQKHKDYIGLGTVNEAEYEALLKAFEIALGICKGELSCFSDSQLMINQLNKSWRVKEPRLITLFDQVKKTEINFDKVLYTRLPREHPMIRQADKLANEAQNENLSL